MRTAIVIAAMLCVWFPAAVSAQRPAQPYRVIAITPDSGASAAAVITVSFDRPMAGEIGALVDPRRLVHIEPAVVARFEWRDPATIRIVPEELLAVGTSYIVSVDSASWAGNRAGDNSAVRSEIRIGRARVIGALPGLRTGLDAFTFSVSGGMKFLYDSPVDTAGLLYSLRLQASDACDAQTIAYHVVAVRPVVDRREAASMGYAWGDADPRFRARMRLVELAPDKPLPEGCDGDFALPPYDARDKSPLLYRAHTAPLFTARLACGDDPSCLNRTSLPLVFTAPVSRDSLRKYVRLEGAGALSLDSGVTITAGSVVRLRTAMKYDTPYQVAIDPALRDTYGRRISGALRMVFRLPDLLPTIGYQSGMIFVTRQLPPTIRLKHVNVDSVTVSTLTVPDSLLFRFLRPRTISEGARVLPIADTVRQRLAVRTGLNETGTTSIPLRIVPSAANRRLTIVTVRLHTPRAETKINQAGSGYLDALPAPVAIIQQTDLSVHAKAGGTPMAVFVTNRRTGKPVGGANVRWLDADGKVVATGTTDSDGVSTVSTAPFEASTLWNAYFVSDSAALRPAPPRVAFVDVAAGDDRVLMRLVGGDYNDPWPRRVTGSIGVAQPSISEQIWRRALVYTERGIYRPGERVFVGAIVRVGPAHELRPPRLDDSLRWEIRRAGDPPIHTSVRALTVAGTSADSVRLSPLAQLGDYQARLSIKRNGAWVDVGGATFSVAEYRVPEFLVAARADSAAVYFGDTVKVHLSATFLFGAPMSGGTVDWSALFHSVPPGTLAIKGLAPGFSIGDQTGWWEDGSRYEGSYANGVDTLGANGRATISIVPAAFRPTKPIIIDVDLSVADVNRQSVGSKLSLLMHSSSFYLAVRTPEYGLARVGRPFDVAFSAVTPDGATRSGQRVQVALVSWRWAEAPSDPGGATEWRWVRDTVWRGTAVSGSGITNIRVTSLRAGPGEVVLTAADEKGRPVRSTVGVWTQSATATAATSTTTQLPVRLPLVVERDSLAVRDEAVIRFDSPFPSAHAWITVEREGILWQRRLTLPRGPAVVRFTADSTFIPNAFVNVLLVPAGTVAPGSPLEQVMRLGRATLKIDVSRRRLAVSVAAAGREHRPGDTISVTVRARDVAGRPVRGHATVWAVDEGVLSLTGWTIPNPFAVFAAAGPRQLWQLSTAPFDFLANPTLFNWPRGFGGRGVAGGSAAEARRRSNVDDMPAALSQVVVTPPADWGLRTDFRSTAFFRADVALNENGEGTFTEKLPDNITTYRLIAVVADEKDRTGVGEEKLLVTKPLLVRAALPRFVRSGDSVFAGGVVNASDTIARPVTMLARGEVMRVVGDSVATATLSARGTEIRLAWRVGEGDSAKAELRVESRGAAGGRDSVMRDGVATRIAIEPGGRPRSQTISGVVRGIELVTVNLPPGTDPARSRVTVRIGSSPLPVFSVARRYFGRSPYTFTEQLASNLRVSLAQLALERSGTLPSDDTVATRDAAQRLVNEIVRRHRPYSGLSYWNENGWSPPWLSVYGGLALIGAREAGLNVSASSLIYLSGYLASRRLLLPRLDTIHGTVADRATLVAERRSTELALAWFARAAGRPIDSLESRLLVQSPQLIWEDRAWLAELAERSGRHAAARSILESLWADVKPAGAMVDLPPFPHWFGFYSRQRPAARLVSATVSAWPDHPMLPALVERMMQTARASGWEPNSQDFGWMIPALTSYLALRPISDAHVTMSAPLAAVTGPVALNALRGKSTDTTLALDGLTRLVNDSLQLQLRLASTDASVFYAVTVDEVSRERPVTPDRHGLIVERWYERYSDGVPITEIAEGELVRVRLRITAPTDRDFVAVEDALPAGLEAVDLSLRTSASLGPFTTDAIRNALERTNEEAAGGSWRTGFGSVDSGWWTPWDYRELKDDKVRWFAMRLWQGTHTVSYVARATTAGRFVRPPAVAEEMYNRGVNGRSDGGTFTVVRKP